MKSDEIRQQFLQFFQDKDHQIVRSTPLYLASDPSLLFINAGMNQFKPIFLGLENAKHKRVANSQRCMRVSGKHNDLEEVGVSPHHHTFFEMLGNWSFGDYYKKEAIQWAWELLTEIWKLPKEKLWVTVFEDEQSEIPPDTEAADLWRNRTDIDPKNILFFGRKDNLWEMGETGPCGPCTEIHIDRGHSFCNLKDQPDHVCSVNGNCQRYVEIWNLVFIQYHKERNQEFKLLPKKHVDTGMGLERITSVIQNTSSNYSTDIFSGIMDNIQALRQHNESQRESFAVPYQVIADHARAAVFMITDGVLPSNEWRGYVLRRIIRRAVRFGTKIDFNEPFLYQIGQTVIDSMNSVYPEILDNAKNTLKTIKIEEERFFKTLYQSLPLVKELIQETKTKSITSLPGEEVFKLYDTYGFPVDIIEEIAQEENLDVDLSGFRHAMEKQKNRARSAWQSQTVSESSSGFDKIIQSLPVVQFIGYDSIKCESSISQIIQDNQLVEKCTKGQVCDLVINPSPFYPESGGQVGDKGEIHTRTARFKVSDTIKITPETSILRGSVFEGVFKINEPITALVDNDRRHSIARNHTATHILHSVLKNILGDHIKQSGSLVAQDRLRFDFTHFCATEPEELDRIESAVNKIIMENHSLEVHYTDIDKALEEGATALFGEKYDQTVRVVKIEDLSTELCGGTHVQNTGEIGLFAIQSESSIAAGIRRIEATTGKQSLADFIQQKQLLNRLSNQLKSDLTSIPGKVEQMQHQLKVQQKKIKTMITKMAEFKVEESVSAPQIVAGVKLIVHQETSLQMDQMRELTDKLKNTIGSGIILLASTDKDKVQFVMCVTQDLTNRFHAGKLISQIAKLADGNGGGRADMAQAGASSPDKLNSVLSKIPEIIETWALDHREIS